MQHRFYSPGIARFTTQDSVFGSLTNPSSLNQSVYADDNPVTLNDPTGNMPRCNESCLKQWEQSIRGNIYSYWPDWATCTQTYCEHPASISGYTGGPIRPLTFHYCVGRGVCVNAYRDPNAEKVGLITLGIFGGGLCLAAEPCGVAVLGALGLGGGTASMKAAEVAGNESEAAVVGAQEGESAASSLAGRNLGRLLASEQQMGQAGVRIAGAGTRYYAP